MSDIGKTTVCNMALSHLAVGVQIGNVITENTAEAKACREFFDIALRSTLKDFKWPWAKKYAALGLVEENPDSGWGFSYRYPSDCIDVRSVESTYDITPGVIQRKPAPFDFSFDSGGKLILSNTRNAYCEYTPLIENYNVFPDNFLLALSFRLAAYIAPRVTKGDPFKLGNRAMQMYMIEGGKATASSFNEPNPAPQPDAEMISIRNS